MENIQVAVRIRPDPEPSIWAIQNSHIVLTTKDLLSKRPLTGVMQFWIPLKARSTFAFDYCYSQEAQNSSIYTQQIRQLVQGSLNGINATIFMYGQTGSGKTYTMLGNQQEAGILPHSFRDLFDTIEKDLNKTYVLRCSYFEIYNEQIYDLLKPPSQLMETLQVNEDARKEFYVKGLTEQSVSSIGEIFDVLKRGEISRHYAQTAMNHHSSRSHAIFRLYVQSITNNFIRNYRREQSQRRFQTVEDMEQQDSASYNTNSNNNSQLQYQTNGALVTESVLNFVDLAGSEKVSNHFEEAMDADTNRRVKEGQYINKSLFFLTQVIFMKAEDKGHVPFRNSSLTKILRSSLDGQSRTIIILCVNPTAPQFEYTLSTLRFGMNAKKIETKVFANIKNQDDDEALKILISDYEKKLHDFEKLRQEEKEQFEQQIHNIQKENLEMRERLSRQNREWFSKLPKVYKQVSWADRFKNDFHLQGAGDVIQTQRKVMKPVKHDCHGRIVLQALKQAKEEQGKFVENYGKVKQKYEELYDSYTLLLESSKENQFYYEQLQAKYRDLYGISKQLKGQLDFKETELSNLQLSEMITFYSGKILRLQMEQKQRGVLQTSNMQNAISLEQYEPNFQSKSLAEKKISRVQLDTIIYSNVSHKPCEASVAQTTPIKTDRSPSIESLVSEDSFQIQFPTYRQVDRTICTEVHNNVSLSESNFKSVLQSFIQEIDNQPLVKQKSSVSSSKPKYKTPDTKKKQSTSQTSIRGKQNVDPRPSHIPKPKSRTKTEELSMLLQKAQMQQKL